MKCPTTLAGVTSDSLEGRRRRRRRRKRERLKGEILRWKRDESRMGSARRKRGMKNAESPKGNQPRSHALHPDWENTFGEHVDSG